MEPADGGGAGAGGEPLTRDERPVRVRPTREGEALRERALGVPRRIAAATGCGLEEIRDQRARLDRPTRALDAAAPSQEPAQG